MRRRTRCSPSRSGPHDGDVNDVELDWGFDGPVDTFVLSSADGAVTGQTGEDGTISFSLDTWSSAQSFFELGLDHIRFGPDHLLFLLVLTLAAAGTTGRRRRHGARSSWSPPSPSAMPSASASPTSTSSPSRRGWWSPPSRSRSSPPPSWPSRGRASDARPWIAALIGLVHGLGFASSLGSLGVVTSQRFVALATFNFGVDVAQTMFVLVVIGGLWLCNRLLDHRVVWVRTAVASSAALVGAAWTVSRLAELPV